MLSIDDMLEKAVRSKASDVHINVGMPPVMRINTELVVMNLPVIDSAQAKEIVLSMLGDSRYKQLEESRDADFAIMIKNGARFRVNAHYQRGGIAISMRVINDSIPDMDTLELPDIVDKIRNLSRGLVLVTGPTGSGKSTTLAAMLEKINETKSSRIITLEDPIEYLYSNKKCQIEQREVGDDVTGFASGLKHAMRQDPDIIMVGEMRDLETTSAAITAAETGHLVLSTLHTINATQTIERILDIYPEGQQNQIRSLLANTLQAVISQTLFKRKDGEGMVPCVEVMICNPAAKNCIRENRLHELPNIIQTSRQIGMQTLDASISEMFFRGMITKESAIAKSSNQAQMQKLLGNINDDALRMPKVY